MQKRVVEAESTLQETSARLSHALNEQVGRFFFEWVSEWCGISMNGCIIVLHFRGDVRWLLAQLWILEVESETRNSGVEGFDFLDSSSLPIGSFDVGDFFLPISSIEQTRRRICISRSVLCYKWRVSFLLLRCEGDMCPVVLLFFTPSPALLNWNWSRLWSARGADTANFDGSDFLTPYEVNVSRVRLIRRACKFKFIVLLLIGVGSRHSFLEFLIGRTYFMKFRM